MNKDLGHTHARERSNGCEGLTMRGVDTETGHKAGKEVIIGWGETEQEREKREK